MRLIFDNEREFLKRKLGIEIPKDSCFMDRMIVKAFNKEGENIKLFKISCNDMELKLIKSYDIQDNEFKSWKELIEDKKERLEDLAFKSRLNIKRYLKRYKEHIPTVPVSGGKDSAVTHYLVNLQIKDEETVFSNTSNETHHTYKYINNCYPDATKISPDEGFYNFVKRTGTVPSRFRRSCCTTQKEMPMIQKLNKDTKRLFFMGMRRAESKNRSEYNIEWKNHKWGERDWLAILPILEWEDLDILLFMLFKNIPFNYLYTIGYGRVGCTNCPYRSSYELLLNKEFLTPYHDRWQRILKQDFIENKKSPSLNCTLEEYLNGAWKGGVVRDIPTEEVLNEFSELTGIERGISDKYFNKTCSCCGKNIKKNDVGLSMKYFGRHIEKFKCLKCLSKELNLTTKELKEQIKNFQSDGCDLF